MGGVCRRWEGCFLPADSVSLPPPRLPPLGCTFPPSPSRLSCPHTWGWEGSRSCRGGCHSFLDSPALRPPTPMLRAGWDEGGEATSQGRICEKRSTAGELGLVSPCISQT